MQILSHFLCCIGFFFRKNFTVQYHGFEKLYCVMMSRDMYRGDLRLALLGIWFKKLSNHANNIFCMYTSSKNDIIIFIHKLLHLYTVYCMNSGLSDVPCNNFQFWFVFRQIGLVQQQTMSNVFNKKNLWGAFVL